MSEAMHGPRGSRNISDEDINTTTPQGTHDPDASGMGGTPAGGRGLSRGAVAKKSPSPRSSGARAKQPTKRTSVKQKAKRAAAKGAGAAAKKVAKKAAGGDSARKAAATKSTAQKRASKTGATRRRVHQRH
jgi:hypothetical protein